MRSGPLLLLGGVGRPPRTTVGRSSLRVAGGRVAGRGGRRAVGASLRSAVGATVAGPLRVVRPGPVIPPVWAYSVESPSVTIVGSWTGGDVRGTAWLPDGGSISPTESRARWPEAEEAWDER